MSEQEPITVPRVVGIVVADLETTAIGTPSRLSHDWAGMAGENGDPVLRVVIKRLRQVRGVGEVCVLTPAEQVMTVKELVGGVENVCVKELQPRPASIAARVRIGRAWNLLAWRGGAGQFTVFDEEYHPAAIARACAESFAGQGAEHVLVVHSHGVFLDVEITSALVHHHLHKNHEMRVTYTPAAPGLAGMVLRADIVKEMGEKDVMPWQLLGYDPKAPTFDTLIREACMQVDPALSKIPNRFCVDTDRSWHIGRELMLRQYESAAAMCLAAARGIAPGVTELSHVYGGPRELEIELTQRRLTTPPGSVPANGSKEWQTVEWLRFFQPSANGDHVGVAGHPEMLVTFGGLGDPLLFNGSLRDILRAARESRALSICVQTDLAGGDIDGLLAAINDGFVDVVTITMYGHTPETYATVAGADLHATVMKNMERLAEATRARGGVPLVVPRLLKVRETIPELEAFFDFWLERCGWAVIDGPTDRAGTVEFKGVVDMAPPKRKPCRRLWDRMMVHADGRVGPCDQDVAAKLSVGAVGTLPLRQMWEALSDLRNKHAAGRWAEIDPCKTCREWHRP